MRDRRRWMRAAACAALACASCSWILVPSVPEPPPAAMRGDECTANVAPAIIDTLAALPGVALMVIGLSEMYDGGGPLEDAVAVTFVAVGAVPAAAFGLSAYHGYVHTSRCERLRARGPLPAAAPPPAAPPPAAPPSSPAPAAPPSSPAPAAPPPGSTSGR